MKILFPKQSKLFARVKYGVFYLIAFAFVSMSQRNSSYQQPTLSVVSLNQSDVNEGGCLVRSSTGQPTRRRFQVLYQDADGQAPVTHKVWVRKIGSFDWRPYTMIRQSSSGTNYRNGVVYYFEYANIPNSNNVSDLANWQYKFDFHDGDQQAAYQPKLVKDNDIGYVYYRNAPVSVNINTSTLFQINYSGKSPLVKRLWLKSPNGSWTPYNMQNNSGNTFGTQAPLNQLGTWKYKFDFHDGVSKAWNAGIEYTVEVKSINNSGPVVINRIWVEPQNPQPGQRVSLHVEYKNVSSSDIRNLTFDYYKDDKKVADDRDSKLNAGQVDEEYASGQHFVLPKCYTYKVIINQNGSPITSAEKQVCLTGTAPIEITRLYTYPGVPKLNDHTDFFVDFRNNTNYRLRGVKVNYYLDGMKIGDDEGSVSAQGLATEKQSNYTMTTPGCKIFRAHIYEIEDESVNFYREQSVCVAPNNAAPIIQSFTLVQTAGANNLMGSLNILDNENDRIKQLRIHMKRLSPSPSDYEFSYDIGDYGSLQATGTKTFEIDLTKHPFFTQIGNQVGRFEAKIEVYDEHGLQATVVYQNFTVQLKTANITSKISPLKGGKSSQVFTWEVKVANSDGTPHQVSVYLTNPVTNKETEFYMDYVSGTSHPWVFRYQQKLGTLGKYKTRYKVVQSGKEYTKDGGNFPEVVPNSYKVGVVLFRPNAEERDKLLPPYTLETKAHMKQVLDQIRHELTNGKPVRYQGNEQMQLVVQLEVAWNETEKETPKDAPKVFDFSWYINFAEVCEELGIKWTLHLANHYVPYWYEEYYVTDIITTADNSTAENTFLPFSPTSKVWTKEAVDWVKACLTSLKPYIGKSKVVEEILIGNEVKYPIDKLTSFDQATNNTWLAKGHSQELWDSYKLGTQPIDWQNKDEDTFVGFRSQLLAGYINTMMTTVKNSVDDDVLVSSKLYPYYFQKGKRDDMPDRERMIGFTPGFLSKVNGQTRGMFGIDAYPKQYGDWMIKDVYEMAQSVSIHPIYLAEFNKPDGELPLTTSQISEAFSKDFRHIYNLKYFTMFAWNPDSNKITQKLNVPQKEGLKRIFDDFQSIPITNQTGVSNISMAVKPNLWNYYDVNEQRVLALHTEENLGNIECSISNGATQQITDYQNAKYLAKSWNIIADHQPSKPVKINLYVRNSEYETLKKASVRIQTPEDMVVSKFHHLGSDLHDHIPDNNTQGIWTHIKPKVKVFGNEGYLLEFEVNDFSELYISDQKEDAASLPVELANFEVTRQKEAVALSWITLSEHNNQYFEIERSEDGKQWKKIGIQKGNGNSRTTLYYHFWDTPPIYKNSQLVYYRLKQVDINGDFEYSKVRSVTLGLDHTLTLYPNPNGTNILVVNYSTEKEAEYIQIYNSQGLLIQKIPLNQENNTLRINISHLKVGYYIVKMGSLQRRFVKK